MKTNFKTNTNGNRGFIKWIIIVVVAVLILSYFGFDIQRVVESPTTQNNFNYVQKIVWTVWHDYLKTPVTYIWDKIFLHFIWNPFIDHLKVK